MSNRRRAAIYLNTSAGLIKFKLTHSHRHAPRNSQGNSENVNENENSIFHLNADTASILKMLSPLPVAIVVVVKSATSLSMLKRCCRRSSTHTYTRTQEHRLNTCVPHGTIQVPSVNDKMRHVAPPQEQAKHILMHIVYILFVVYI